MYDDLVYEIKRLYDGIPHNIPDKYFVLMADYIAAVCEAQDSFKVDPLELAKSLPDKVRNISDMPLNGIYGVTDKNGIRMNSALNSRQNKLYFFHELTHALQTREKGNEEECSFSNGKNGMFLVEGATQFTAELLYHFSNGTNVNYRTQTGVVRGHPEHTPYSPLSEYQLNGSILMLLSHSIKIPIAELLGLGFKENGREAVKQKFESFQGLQGKFEGFMSELEQIYAIDKLMLTGYGKQISGPPVLINMNGTKFYGSIQTQGEQINKIERELVANFIENNTGEYIMKNYKSIGMHLTSPELRQNFMNAVINVARIEGLPEPGMTEPSGPRR